jgi:hypothetical protein
MRLIVKSSVPHDASAQILIYSVADPDPYHVFGPPGSGSFYHQEKIVRKTLISDAKLTGARP